MTTSIDPDPQDVSRHVWEARYRHREEPADRTIEDTWRRVARAVSAVEPRERELWERRFLGILKGFKFLPGGRILAGAGTPRNVTLFNCFVMGSIEDSMGGIFHALQEGAITMQQGGGVGWDFSTLRPRGTYARGVGMIASGPVSFLGVWDAMCATVLSTGARRGAMMATLRCNHPDIEEFVAAKQTAGALRHFNLSVQVSDAFMDAVRRDAEWPLLFPETPPADPHGARVHRLVHARELWETIMRATYEYAEPGVLFTDRVNRLNNLWYCEHITSTNPCGEVPLPPYGACNLGSLNLTQFVCQPLTPQATIDEADLAATTEVATRFLDNVIDVSQFPLPRQRDSARATRRVGLGITGLGDALIMLGLHYASDAARQLAARIMRLILHEAYRTSVALAQEKGAFRLFNRDSYLEGAFVRSLPDVLRAAIAQHGIRNSHLVAIAPTGTISLLANNVSSGIEPVFASVFEREMLNADGTARRFRLTDYALGMWRRAKGDGQPASFVCANDLSPQDQIAMQAALQPYVDNAISKTIQVPEDFPFGAFKGIYEAAYDMGLKGCTTFRPNPVTGAVVTAVDDAGNAPHCCAIEREPD